MNVLEKRSRKVFFTSKISNKMIAKSSSMALIKFSNKSRQLALRFFVFTNFFDNGLIKYFKMLVIVLCADAN